MTALDPSSLFREYAAERRSRGILGFDLEVLPHLSRHTPRDPGVEGLVLFADLPPGREVAAIRAEKEYFRARGLGLEWKVFEFDRPSNLRALLEAEGFAAGTEELFLVRPVGAAAGRAPRIPPGFRIEPVETARGIDDVVRVQEAVWGRAFGWLRPQLAGLLRQRPRVLWLGCAYEGDRPVATGWAEFGPGSRFADLHGGAVLPEVRGRGIYSALLARRSEEARRRGYPLLAVDAAPMSRPILVAKGFQPVCGTVPMRG